METQNTLLSKHHVTENEHERLNTCSRRNSYKRKSKYKKLFSILLVYFVVCSIFFIVSLLYARFAAPEDFYNFDQKITRSEENSAISSKLLKEAGQVWTDSNTSSLVSSSIYKASKYKYENPWPEWRELSFSRLIKWKFGPLPNAEIEYEQELSSAKNFLKLKSDCENNNQSSSIGQFCSEPLSLIDYDELKATPKLNNIKVTWFGHSSMFLQFSSGLNVFCDPVFSYRASPVSFLGPARQIKIPASVKELKENGVKVDVLAISHGHYDHFDYKTVEEFVESFPEIKIVAAKDLPMSKKQVLKSTELYWWQSTTIENVKITFVPSQHWSNRSPFDIQKHLWGGFIFENLLDQSSAYFLGDSGYCQVFKEEISKFKFDDQPRQPFTVSLLPIGAYKPRWFMGPQHVSPEEAVQIHKEIGTMNSVGMHWLTFELANDKGFSPLLELEYFKEINKVGNFNVQKVGETVSYS